jgi:hypothetical protein
MKPTIAWTFLFVAMAALCLGCTSAVPSAAPAAPPLAGAAAPAAVPAQLVAVAPAKCCTLPEFLGLCDLNRGLGGGIQQLRNCLGMQYPGIEGTPPLRAIADPANEKSPCPEISTAAKVKEQQDMADQKIKALRYLAGIGCGKCYPDIEKSFLDALSDCTEEVRYEAIQALRKVAGCPCQCCRQDCCCTPAIHKRLEEMGCGTDEKTGCPKEPSARVRRVARLAAQHCGPLPPEPEKKVEKRPVKEKPSEPHKELPVEKLKELPTENHPPQGPNNASPSKLADTLGGAAGKVQPTLPPLPPQATERQP